MAKAKIYRSGYRVRKAYFTAFRIVLSYLWLKLKSKIFGQKYYENRIADLNIKTAFRVRRTIIELQGLFVKVGQMLSVFSNYLPEQFQAPLADLQNNIPARPYSEIEQRILQEFGKKPRELFAEFSETPIAAASIGQAHLARLHNGTQVVVKVQHANIEETAEVDLRVIEKLTRLFARFMDIEGMNHAYSEVRKMIEEELDFRLEAQAMERVRANLAGEPKLQIPELHPEFCTQRVLCTTFYDGVKIGEVAQLKAWELDTSAIGHQLVDLYCKMVFRDGYYHADPHPGNILVLQDGTIVLLDFGAVASLQPQMRTGILELIEGAVKNDTEKIIDALMLLGFIADEKAAIKIAEKAIDALRNFLENEVEFDGLNLENIQINPFESSLFKLITDIGLDGIANTVQIPKDYVLLNRMVTLLIGICTALDHKMNPIQVVEPYFKTYMLGERGDTVTFVKDLVQRTVTSLIALPNDVQKILKKAQRGELEMRIEGQREQTLLFYALGQQFLYALLLITTGVLTVYLYEKGESYWMKWGMGICGFLLFLLIKNLRRGAKMKRNL
ncbi:MAG: ABC1 kinase family protein [Saprospiraceae bacterium]